MILMLTMFFGCNKSPDEIIGWVSGDPKRDSVLEGGSGLQQENGELLAVWYGELFDVEPGEGFEWGELGFFVGYASENNEEEDFVVYCEVFSDMTLVETGPDCDDCIFSFTVDVSEAEVEGSDEGNIGPCEEIAEDPLFDSQISLATDGLSNLLLEDDSWVSWGDAEWAEEDREYFFWIEMEYEEDFEFEDEADEEEEEED